MPIKKNNKDYGTRVKFENVPPTLDTLNATANGTYTPTSPYVGYSSVTVNVSAPEEPFYVEDLSGSGGTLSIVKSNASAPTIEVFKSTDKTNWTSMGSTDTTAITASVPASGKLYLKATANKWGSEWDIYNYISVDKKFQVGGSVMSLLYGDNFQGQTTLPVGSTYTFFWLFRGSQNILSASNLVLPATTMTDFCYYGMFQECENLVVAPTALPATTMAAVCYGGMFYNCNRLGVVPKTLPATTLAENCYGSMFDGCTSLTTAPALPATTLATYCYQSMFQNCSSLNNVTTYAQDISATDCINNWLNNVSGSGDFYNLGGATYTADSGSGIPTGWTEHTSL